jgi:serine/threonine protein kinase
MRLGDYTLRECLPIAGGGIDALADDPLTGREIRLWIGAPGSGAARAELGSVEELAQTLARVYHASLPRVLGAGIVEDRAFLKVQAYRGILLSDRPPTEAPDVPASLDLVRGIGAGLVKAHRAGVIHGAVSEAEILVADDGPTLLLHLGFGPFLGARPPRSPEDLDSPGGSEDSDVFGLARVLVRLATGEDPFAGGRPEDEERLLRAGVRREPEDFPSELPEGLRRFLHRAVHFDRSRRIHRAEELVGDLGVIRASWDALSAVGETPLPFFPWLLRRRVLIPLALGLVAAIVAILRSCR